MGSIQCSVLHKVSFITNLFSRHRHADVDSVPAVNWPGQSGQQYRYEVFTLDTPFKPLPGNYIYARQAEDGEWTPVYIAQTRDLHQRLEGHVTKEDAAANGATHLLAHYCSSGQAARCSEERDLILRWHPVCNDEIVG
jgi:hypothetical protein